jgi:spermidine synthase
VSTIAATSWVVFGQDRALLSDPAYPGEVRVAWSPYQKVECTDGTDELGPTIYVNGILHQGMRPRDWIEKSIYQTPYAERADRGDRAPFGRVLIMGAGSGNDVTAALANGAEHVDAVEIDPVIAELGRRYHPARPYDDPRVRLTIDDARSFLTHSQGPYDLVIFALTDSLIRVSPMAQLRLENYLFTEQAIQRAYHLLSDQGSLVFYNFYRRPWLVEKLRRGMHAATGQWPYRVHLSKDFAVLALDRRPPGSVSADDPGADSPSGPGALARYDVDVATDDWPFLYLEKHGVPGIYLGAMALFVVLAAAMVIGMQVGARRRSRPSDAPSGLATKSAFALMGVAFLLLETKSVIQFSLLFGTTWLNNSLVFLAILLSVLAANWTVQALRGRWLVRATFAALIAASLATLVYPLSNLLYLENAGLRFVAASLLTFSPIFFANLLFSLAFRDQPAAEHLFGWNLLGATLGGVLEYSSMALGYNALAWIVAACYALAFVLLLKDGVFAAKSPQVVETKRVPQLVP